jgi:hypothetical protein
VPGEAASVHEHGVTVEERGKRVEIARVPCPHEHARHVGRRHVVARRNVRPRPAAVETDELGPVLVQDVACHDALFPALRHHHDDVSTRTNVLDVMGEVLELLEIEGADHRAMELGEESVRGARRVQTIQIFFTVQDVDAL